MKLDLDALEGPITRILSAPDTDLSAISAKRVRKALLENPQYAHLGLTPEILKMWRGEVDQVISRIFDNIYHSALSEWSGRKREDDVEAGRRDEIGKTYEPPTSEPSENEVAVAKLSERCPETVDLKGEVGRDGKAKLESTEFRRSSPLSLTTIPDLTDRIVRPDDWQYCAAGGFGDVFRCRYASDDGVKEVAVKAFRFSFSVNENKHDEGKTVRMIHRELGIWRRLDHRNIVPFLGIAYGFGRQGGASLVSTWMPHGTLHAFLETYDDRLAVVHRLQLLVDIANGLHYLHSFPMIHGDLTSNNVLLNHNLNACLADFGCASLVGELPEGLTYLKMSTMRPGTLRWAAPEHFSLDDDEMKHTVKSDIYSFGNMALLLLSGKYPWSEVRSDTAVMLRLSQGLKPGRPLTPAIDDRHWALVEWCWSSIPQRPLAGEVVSSLQQSLDACDPLPSLRELLSAQTASAPNHPGNDDLHLLLSEEAHGRPEEAPYEHAKSGHSDTNKSTKQKPDRSISSKSRTSALSNGSPPISKWVRSEFLGEGMYGSVYLAVDIPTGRMFAVKQAEKVEKNTHYHDYVFELRRERDILSGLNHPHIIAYFGSEETMTHMSIFLEYVPGGSIGSCLRAHGRFKEEVIKSFTAHIMRGVAYLHAEYITHRNIDANNVLVHPSGVCKLSGFGNARRADDGDPMYASMFWTAPEVTISRGERPYGPKVDIWSAGCVLLKMWTGGKDGDVMAWIARTTTRQPPQWQSPSPVSNMIMSDLAIDFSDRCFAVNPETRASAAELLQHPYLMLEPDWVFTEFT